MKTALVLTALMLAFHTLAADVPTTIRGLKVLRAEPCGVRVTTGKGIEFIASEKMTPQERKEFGVIEPEDVKRFESAKVQNATNDADLAAKLQEWKRNRLAWERSPEGQAALAEQARVEHNRQVQEWNEAQERRRAAASEAAAESAAAATRAQQQADAAQRAMQFRQEYFRQIEEDAQRERELRAAEQTADELRRLRQELEIRRLTPGR